MSEAEVFLESKEVISQRVIDLVHYFKHVMPSMADGGEVSVKRSDLMLFLGELDEELDYSIVHRTQLLINICDRIRKTMMPNIMAEVTRLDAKTASDEERDDSEYAIGYDVSWSTLFPEFAGDFERVSGIAGNIVSCFLNDAVTQDLAWANMGDSLIDNLSDSIEYLLGMIGFLMLFTYIKIVEKEEIPPIRCYLASE